jgi:hypothetical protein
MDEYIKSFVCIISQAYARKSKIEIFPAQGVGEENCINFVRVSSRAPDNVPIRSGPLLEQGGSSTFSHSLPDYTG